MLSLLAWLGWLAAGCSGRVGSPLPGDDGSVFYPDVPDGQGDPDAGSTDREPPGELPGADSDDLNPDGSFNYAAALQKSLFFFEAQRSGPLPASNRVGWRGDSGMQDGRDRGVDLTGGWYDAGDHVKFGFPLAASATMLAWALLQYRQGFDQAGQLEIALDNLRWVADYLAKAHTAPEELWGQVGQGSLDHAFWGPAEVMPTQRPAYKIDRECPGSDLAGETAAALAAASMVFRSTDPAYAQTLLQHARQLYSFADGYRGKYTDCIQDAQGFYNSWSGFGDELVWGAVWVFEATGESAYLVKAEAEYRQMAQDFAWTHAWDDKSYGCHVKLAGITGKDEYARAAEAWLDFWTTGHQGRRVHYTPGGLAWLDQWGSLRYAANTAFVALVYADRLRETGDPERAARYHDFAVRQIDYMLGDNPAERSYLVGFGDNWPKNPHHRTAHGSWSNNIAEPEENRHILYGALVGGPDQNDGYCDDRTNYVNNEVACDYNAGFTGALAGLVQEFGGRPLPDFPPAETPEPEFFVTARVQSSGPRHVELSAILHNRSAWPARATSHLSFRYFVDLTEVFAAGHRLDDVTLNAGYSQGGGVSGPVPFDAARNLFYVEVSLEGVPLSPAGQSEHKKEVQFRLALPFDSDQPVWDSGNDWSFEGLDGSSHLLSDRIPVYEAGHKIFGREP